VEIGLYKRCAFVTLEEGATITIGNNTGASGTTFAAGKSITIGNDVMIGAYCTITDTDFHNPDPAKRNDEDVPTRPVVIEDHVFLGMNCMILKGVTIGTNAVIGANSVVMSNIPPNSIAMGNPCKVMLKRNWGRANG
jgi:acetyltransferase-like isoleucine patch superfamily enzyme